METLILENKSINPVIAGGYYVASGEIREIEIGSKLYSLSQRRVEIHPSGLLSRGYVLVVDQRGQQHAMMGK